MAEDPECLPDDDGVISLPYEGLRCAEPPLDGGSDASTKAKGCRLHAQNDGPSGTAPAYAPHCSRDADRNGTDGVSCASGTDCAPGFDCVEGDKGPVCRRYCCSGSCEEQTSQNAGATFCDLRRLVDSLDHKAPVCMPLKSCKLFAAGDCSELETCAVVTEKGQTGCVERGTAKAGEPCETDHCEAGLTCLGSAGGRRCYKLCRIEGSDCTPTQTCTPGSIFHDMTLGVCQDD
jgi:hypothetical protein